VRAARVLLGLLLLWLISVPLPAAAQEVSFGQPQAQAELGLPVVFSTTLEASDEPPNVELLLRVPGERSATVMPAELRQSGAGWLAEATLDGHVPPNTAFSYRFRVRQPGAEAVLGPEAVAVVADNRFAWRTIEGPIVRLHWYEGDEGFARRALEIGERAIDEASQLLGVVETEPVDFFIYTSEADLRGALGPGTRENVGGQAHASIRTMFGLIQPHEVNHEWVDILVAHELTHLVFDTATDNPYHTPPRWLNEGVAVYLSEGYGRGWQRNIEDAVADRSIIPLDGLGGLFPTTFDQFQLAYAQSVSAVDFFIREHGEQTLWDLVGSYAQGVSDDEAFHAATGADLAAFNSAWMASLGLEVPQPVGPQPGLPGPVPPGWASPPATPQPGPGVSPGASPQVPLSPDPAEPTPSPPPDGREVGDDGLVVGLLAGLVVVGGVVLAALLVRRRLLT
jgi:hypothetical protein